LIMTMPWMMIGVAAAALTTFSFIPQIVKVVRHRSARDVSVITIVQLAAGVSLWVVYGILSQGSDHYRGKCRDANKPGGARVSV